ncbi:hypothetical protein [Nocardia sp. NPDC049707]|uniref:hypothetical protein n=1 Tax=Nocardia sp. NPDC049707 TaxID=3154735 RepID=UPI00342D867E
MNREELARKLWAAIEDLDENDGFVLTACEDAFTFTRLRAAGYSDAYLDVEPLNIPDARAELQRLGVRCVELEQRVKTLDAETATKQARLDDLNAAIANALGRAG